MHIASATVIARLRVGQVRHLFVSVLLAMTPATAAAQFGNFDKIFEAFSDVSVWWGPFIPTHGDVKAARKDDRWVGSYGAEFLFALSRSPRDAAGKRAVCATVPGKQTEQRERSRPTGVARDTLEIERVFSMREDCPTATHDILMEVGVGYGQTTRFVIQDPGHEVSGIVREIPSVTVYVEREPRDGCDTLGGSAGLFRSCSVTWYSGLRTGVTQIVDPVLAIGTDRYSDANAKSLQFGLVGGGAFSLPLLSMFTGFVEGSYVYRPFPTLAWKHATSGVTAPSGRTNLDLSGWTVAVGVQFQVRKTP